MIYGTPNMLNAFLLQIKLAGNKDSLRDIQYRASRHPAISAKQLNLITNLCVYKSSYIDGKDDLAQGAKILKIPQKYIKMII